MGVFTCISVLEKAESRGIDKTPEFKMDLDGYCGQLMECYMSET